MNINKNLNNFFLVLTCTFSALLLILSILACWFSYGKQLETITGSMDKAYSYLNQEYENLRKNYLQIYLPIWENNGSAYDLLYKYFSAENTQELTPFEKAGLSDILNQMCIRDSRVSYIALYSENRTDNYIKYTNSSSVAVLSDEFPYYNDMADQDSKLQVYGVREVSNLNGSLSCFAICSNIPGSMGNGRILVGYHLDSFYKANSFLSSAVPSMRFFLADNKQLIFDSNSQYHDRNIYIPEEPYSGYININGQKFYVLSDYSANVSTLVVCTALSKDVFRAAHRDTPWILGITFLFLAFSILIYTLMNRSVSKEVVKLKNGLEKIIDNNLTYRLPNDFLLENMPEIAENINLISSRLEESIRKAYYFELKQKDAQLAQLQATFNPHFLYNTLEMLRGKIYANGDEESAELISDLSSIFRSFIGTKTFITIHEELVYSQKYLALLNARYGDKVLIRYAVNPSLLSYGIIRNVLQIIIENYFVHGFDSNIENNKIQITGNFLDDKDILLSVEDNGVGMSADELAILNKKISEPIRNTDKSYGLKNLNQRLTLFYGPDYGLTILNNPTGGLTVQIRIRKILPEPGDR